MSCPKGIVLVRGLFVAWRAADDRDKVGMMAKKDRQ
jgi:hypothetical protein